MLFTSERAAFKAGMKRGSPGSPLRRADKNHAARDNAPWDGTNVTVPLQRLQKKKKNKTEENAEG